MAVVRFGGAIADARGRCGDVVFSRNRAGAYVRGWIDTPQPASEFRDVCQAALTTTSQRWVAALSELQRQSWRDFTATHLWTNAVGTTMALCGSAWYVRVNWRHTLCHENPIDAPPCEWVIPAPPVCVLAIALGEFYPVITCAPVEDWDPLLCLWVDLTLPLLGARRAQRSDWRNMNIVNQRMFMPREDWGPAYDYRFHPVDLVEGDRVAARARFVHRLTGATSQAWVGETLVLPAP